MPTIPRKATTSALVLSLIAFRVCLNAWACSVDHISTAAEIVERADTIVRAKAVRFEPQDKYGGLVTFEALEVLKGKLRMNPIGLSGRVERYDGANDKEPPYNFVRPGGRHGNCFADDYKLGTEYLLLLRNGSATWAPLAATNEEVSGAADRWVWWVKGYLATGGDGSGTTKSR